ncbi:MAG TPA: ABC-2 family transporter protein [Vicinamibacterales bacterium]|jgi:viologen exporter family transport system permease protein|nr:ABC-2 family transporter protein [Vicinamibacterales bacterium]
MSTWTFARALFATNLRAALALRGAFAIQALFMLINNLTFFIVWWVLLRRVPDLRGWRLDDIEVLFGITATSFGLVVAVAGGVRHLGRAIEEGELDTLLTQPKPTLLYALGMRSNASGVGDMVSGVLFLVMSGHLTLTSAPLLVVLILASAATFLGCGIVFHSLPFWLSRTETVSRQLWELTITFAIYPEPLFGGALRLLLFTAIPAGFVAYLPARMLRDPSPVTLAASVGAALAYVAIAVWVFDRGVRRYTSGSRFVAFG